MTEVWKAVPDFEGAYEVSNLGRVRSLDRVAIDRNGRPMRFRGKMLVAHKGGKGFYWHVTLCAQGILATRFIHELVAFTFKGPRPPGAWIAHGDGDSDNNADSNLRHDTPAGNHADKTVHGTQPLGEDVHNAVLTAEAVRSIRVRSRAASGQLALEFGVSRACINQVRAGKTWRHVC